MARFGPFPLTVVFRMSKAAPLRRMPPPGLPVTVHVSMCRVTVEPESGEALMPMPVAGLAVPWMVRLRRVMSPEVMVRASAPVAGAMTALFLPTMVSGAEAAMVVVKPAGGGASVPLTSTTDLDPVLAIVIPFCAEHTGADALPVPVVSEHVVVPLVPT